MIKEGTLPSLIFTGVIRSNASNFLSHPDESKNAGRNPLQGFFKVKKSFLVYFKNPAIIFSSGSDQRHDPG
jgi:hypothetical protein